MKYFLFVLVWCTVSLCTKAQNIALNTAFGNNGIITKSPDKKDNVFYERARSVIQLPDGKLLVAIEVDNQTTLARFLADGSLDKTYGTDGYSDRVYALQSHVTRTQEGKALMVGVRVATNANLVIARYDEEGRLDTSFGENGLRTIPTGTFTNTLTTTILQQDGKILLAGSLVYPNSIQAFVMRLLSDGMPDDSFSNAGLLKIATPGITLISSLVINGTKLIGGATITTGAENDFAVMQYMEDGMPDLDFGDNGLATFNVDAYDNLVAAKLQKDGKIVIAGSTLDASHSTSKFIIARLTADGLPDNTFNQTGITSVNFGNSGHMLRTIGIDVQGRVTIAGNLTGFNSGLGFARLKNDGSLDESYGDNGQKFLDLTRAITLLDDGWIIQDGSFVVVGYNNQFAVPYSTVDYMLVHLSVDGQPDEKFGSNGIIIGYVPGKEASINQLKPLSDGNILFRYTASGNAGTQGVVRLLPNGKPDLTFGEQSLLQTSNVFEVLPDQRVVTFESVYDNAASIHNIVMRRYDHDGKPDPSFGNGGQKALTLSSNIYVYVNKAAIDTKGRILLTGYVFNADFQQQGFIARFDSDGNIDKQFGAEGKILFDGAKIENPDDIIFQPGGEILVKGFALPPPTYQIQPFIRHFTADGLLDENFGMGGTAYLPNDYYGFINRIIAQPDGKILVASLTTLNDQKQYNVLLRYNQDGTFDTNFGENGAVKIPDVMAILLKDGKILIGTGVDSQKGRDAALVLLNADGSPDNSFGPDGTKVFKLSDDEDYFTELVVQGDHLFAAGQKNKGLDQEGLLAGFLIQSGKDTTVSGFTLVNASANKDIEELKEGDILDLTKLPRTSLNIRANTTLANVGSVSFELTGARKYKHTENGVPFALFSDNKGDYFGGALPEGEYTLTATPYSQNDGKGNKGTSLTIHFKIVYPAALIHFVLINAQTGKDIGELKEGDVINLASLQAQAFSIRAATRPDTVGSVVFTLKGAQVHQNTENLLPYSLFGDDKKQYSAWAAGPGGYTLTAIPYSAPRGTGAIGTALTINFTVIDGLENSMTISKPRQATLAADERATVKLSAVPNPFTSQSTIRFLVPTTGYTTVRVYNLSGAEVATLHQGKTEGKREYTVSLEGKGLPAGMYLIRLIAEGYSASTKVVLQR